MPLPLSLDNFARNMLERSSRRNENIDFFLIGIVNVLPIAGYFLFDWSFTAVALLFWLEAVMILLFYGSLAMFTTSESRVEEREKIAIVGPVGGRYFSEKPRQLVRFLPSVYPKNLRFIVPTTGFMLLIAIAVGGGVTGWGVGRRAGGISDENVLDFFAQFSVFEMPSMLGIGLLIVGAHFVTFYRYYFGTGQYRELTAYMVLEIQVKYTVCYCLMFFALVIYTIAAFFVIGITLPAVVSESAARVAWEVLVAGSFLAVKLAFEWSRFRGERQPDLSDDSFTANFSPTPPPPVENTK